MTRSILIGIDMRGDAGRLDATLAAIAAATSEPHRVITLDDASKRGGAAAFNALVATEIAEVYVLLECGALPAAGWLRRMLGGLDTIPQAGLAGPSTNRAWNRQCVLPPGSPSGAEAASLAKSVERRFGAACRLLEPLHSLSDFCYVVTRRALDAVGEADEEYGLGPCWEMDYNIRAQRAGFRGIWVCGAYVHRTPVSESRAAVETSLFEASKRRYQDKFCGLRLRGLQQDYREHCRGDACGNFAPRDLITIRSPGAAEAADAPAPLTATAPLATCIMPTLNRRSFIPTAVRCFLAQTYPNAELLVLDDGSEPIRDLLPEDPRIRYLRASGKNTIGAKRNMACAEARGEYILHWDDDDWYPAERVARQVEALRAHPDAAVCGSSTLYFYAPGTNSAFRYHCNGPGAAPWMGALAYPKRTWQSRPFETVQIAEDVKFLARIPPAARIDLDDPALSVATIHDTNTSPKQTTGSFWFPENPATVLALIAPGARMVSCIMPTWNRRPFIPLALECFRVQTYGSRELIIVDDGDHGVGDLVDGAPGVQYIRLNRRTSIGAKRNVACEAANGEFVAHWDDDDWYSPHRLERQLNPLAAGTHDVSGLTNRYVLEMPAGIFWTTTPEVHRRMFVGDVHGGTVVYRKAIWRGGARYPDANLAEDAAFLRRVSGMGKRILRLDNTGEFVYLRHGHNTWKFESGRFLDPSGWRRSTGPAGFTEATLEAYRSVSSGC
jgi:glycosyltransferase involved in cell wall biosynthesis